MLMSPNDIEPVHNGRITNWFANAKRQMQRFNYRMFALVEGNGLKLYTRNAHTLCVIFTHYKNSSLARTAVLIIVALFSQLTGHSQPYHMLPANGVFQEHASHSFAPCVYGDTFIYYFTGDTVIGNDNYLKLHYQGSGQHMCSGYPSQYSHTPDTYVCALRQDSVAGKVFVWFKDSLAELLLYDFSLDAGDTIHFIQGGYAYNYTVGLWQVIDSVDTVSVNGAPRKRLNYTNYNCDWCFDGTNAVIEGIGNTRGFIFPRTAPDPNAPKKTLTCVSVDGIKIFGADSICFQPLDSIGYSFNQAPQFDGIDFSISSETEATVCLHTPLSNDVKTLVVRNILGQRVASTDPEANTTCFDKHELSKGIYVISLISNNGTVATIKWLHR
jgi:hypothetical protein